MSWHLIKTNNKNNNYSYKEFMLDSENDIETEPKEFGPIGIGSIAYVCSDSNNAMSKIYMKNGNGKWTVISTEINPEEEPLIPDEKHIIPVTYGFHVNSNESDPSYAVTYINEAVGSTPAFMNYSSGIFSYGSWVNAFFMPKPCMLKSTGAVDYYLNPNDYTKKENGDLSDINNDNYNGNAMMEWGQNNMRIWYKIVPDADPASYSVYISNKKLDTSYIGWSFYDRLNNLQKHFYTPIYKGSIVNNKLRSLSGKTPAYSNTISQFADSAKANGLNWNIETFSDKILIYFLLILMGKSLDLQKTYGNGHLGGSGGESNLMTTGTLNNKGLFYGSDSNSFAVKTFGMENQWGDQWNFILGLMLNNNTYKYKMTEGTLDGTTVDHYDPSSVIGMKDKGTAPVSGYVSKMYANSECILPYTTLGSNTTYYTDYFNKDSDGIKVAAIGGYSAALRYCGFYINLGLKNTDTSWAYGSSLSYK